MLITNLTPQDYWFGPLHLPAGNGQTLTVDDTSATSLYLTDDNVADMINTLYASSPAKISVSGAAAPFPRATGAPAVLHGDGAPEGIVYAGQGSVYLRRDQAIIYIKATGIHVNTGWSAVASGGVTSASLFSQGPPANPSDGDTWNALAVDTGSLATTNGTVWTFRYNAASGSTYKWEFLGGAPISVQSSGGVLATQGGAYVNSGASYTVVRNGDYEASLFLGMSGLNGQVNYGIGINGSNPANPSTNFGYEIHTGPHADIFTGVTSTLKIMHQDINAGNTTSERQGLIIRPVRVA